MGRERGYVTRQAERLRDGKINRRRFVMHALSAGVTLPTAMSLASRAEAMVPRKGGVLRQAVRAGGDHFADALAPILGNSLTSLAADGSVTGGLAEAFHADRVTQDWIFNLRDGVEFHSGKALDPRDVAATLQHFSVSRPGLDNIAGIEQEGAHSLRVRLRKPDPSFARQLADPSLAIAPRTNDRLDGTGGYRLEELTETRAILTRNPSYWKADAAHFDAIDIRSLPDPKTRLHAILNGDVDLADGIDPRTVALLRRTPTVGIVETDGAEHLGFAATREHRPYDKGALCRALSAALPRRELVDKVLLGHGRAVGESAPEQARDHLRRSGHAGQIVIAASDAAFPGAVDAARLTAAACRSAGLEAVVIEASPAEWNSAISGADFYTVAQAKTAADPGHLVLAMERNEILACSTALAVQPGAQLISDNWWFARETF